MAGRPSSFSQKLADTICERIANGESLRRICEDKVMPSKSTVLAWLADAGHEEFRTKYVRARELQADHYADEIVEIADTPEIGTKTVSKATGMEITEGDMVEHRKLRILSRQWYAEKLNPKKYGQKLGVEHSGTIELASALEAARKRRRDGNA